MLRRELLGWALFGVALTLASNASANPADSFGLGSRSTALGGAVSAHVSDFSANYYNPAGLALGTHTQLTAGLVHVSPTLSVGSRAANTEALTAWQLGWVVPGQVWGLPVAFGLAAQLSGDRLARIVTFTEEDQRWFIYEHRPEQLYLSSNLALKLTPWLAVGGGLSFLASTDGVLRVTGTAVQPFGEASEFDSQLEHEVLAELASVRYPSLGLNVALSPELHLALVYRGEGSVQLDVDSEINGDIQFGPAVFPTQLLLTSQTVQSFVPQQLTLGGHWAVASQLDVQLDLAWVDWSRLPSPVSATGSELNVQGEGLLLPELPPQTELRSANLRDQLNARVGAELQLGQSRLLTWALRAGYAFQPTGLTPSSASNLIDADAHVFSTGVGLGLGQWGTTSEHTLQVDVHAQWGLLGQQPLAGQAAAASGHWLGAGSSVSLKL